MEGDSNALENPHFQDAVVMNELKYRGKINSIPAIQTLTNSFQAKRQQAIVCLCWYGGRVSHRQIRKGKTRTKPTTLKIPSREHKLFSVQHDLCCHQVVLIGLQSCSVRKALALLEQTAMTILTWETRGKQPNPRSPSHWSTQWEQSPSPPTLSYTLGVDHVQLGPNQTCLCPAQQGHS